MTEQERDYKYKKNWIVIMKAKEAPDTTPKSQGIREVSSMTTRSKSLRTKPVVSAVSKTKDLSSCIRVGDAGESLIQAPESKDSNVLMSKAKEECPAPQERDTSPSLCLSDLTEHPANGALTWKASHSVHQVTHQPLLERSSYTQETVRYHLTTGSHSAHYALKCLDTSLNGVSQSPHMPLGGTQGCQKYILQ